MDTVTNEQLMIEVQKLNTEIPKLIAEEVHAVNDKVDIVTENQHKHQEKDDANQKITTDKFASGEAAFTRIENKVDAQVIVSRSNEQKLDKLVVSICGNDEGAVGMLKRVEKLEGDSAKTQFLRGAMWILGGLFLSGIFTEIIIFVLFRKFI